MSRGRNLAVEYRWAEGQYDRLSTLAADLVRRNVAVIVSTGGQTAALAARRATSTIPIVFTLGADPVRVGLVGSLNRPGGNVTGVSLFITQMASKRLGLLLEMVPKVETVAVLLNPSNPASTDELADAEKAARGLNRALHVLNAQNDAEIDAVFATMVELRAGALLIGADPYLNSRREKLIALAARHSIRRSTNSASMPSPAAS